MSTTKNPPAEAGKDPKKTADLPPYGPRNADPLTGAPGSHPIETGVGAVLGGVASGLALGAVGGPLGAIAGAIAGGAFAGGLAGKGVGELIDPTTEDNWVRDYFAARKLPAGMDDAPHAEAYRFGIRASNRHSNRTFLEIMPDLRAEWQSMTRKLSWDDAWETVRAGYDRAWDERSKL